MKLTVAMNVSVMANEDGIDISSVSQRFDVNTIGLRSASKDSVMANEDGTDIFSVSQRFTLKKIVLFEYDTTRIRWHVAHHSCMDRLPVVLSQGKSF